MRDIDTEARDSAVSPESQGLVEVLPHLGVRPVEVGLGRVEDVEVELARRAVGGRDLLPS
jgi:cobalamin biosynthesis Mg chelatase CobN